MTQISTKAETEQLAWHYTTGEAFQAIMDSGILMTTSAGCPTHERSVLWFSMNQIWEPTANKAIIHNGQYRGLTMRETKERFGGLVRFGFPQSKLVPWLELWKHSGILPSHKRAMEKTGRAQGANPHHWMGCFSPIPVAELVAEIMDQEYLWFRVMDDTQAEEEKEAYSEPEGP